MEETEVEWSILYKFSRRIDGREADRRRVGMEMDKKEQEEKYRARASTEMGII